MNGLTQSERDGLDDVFSSINTGDKYSQFFKKLPLLVLAKVKYLNIFSSHISNTLCIKVKALR